MAYTSIENLYRSQDILLFRECWAMEKVHGTSAHIAWRTDKVWYSSGGESSSRFVAIFNDATLTEGFKKLGHDGHDTVVVYGEAYGGKCQGMRTTYGDELRFIAFEVKVGDAWLSVPNADQVATGLGLEFVPYRKVSTDIATLDAERDRPSEVAVRRGIVGDKVREGVVLRPLIEVTKNNDQRIIAKHKTEQFSERATPQKIIDPSKLAVLSDAKAIADEWVSEVRMAHVLDKLRARDLTRAESDAAFCIADTPAVIHAMIADIYREANGEIVESKEAKAAIGKRTAQMFKARLQGALK